MTGAPAAGPVAESRGTPAVPAGTFLAQLAPADRAALIQAGTAVTFEPGASPLSNSPDDPQVFVLLCGQVKVGLVDEDGHQTLIEVRSAGDLVGELESLDDGPGSATITAVGAVHAVVIPAERFLGLLYRHPCVGLTLLRFTARRLRAMNRRRMDLRRKVPDRLHRLLVDFAEQYGEPDGPTGAVRIGFDLTQAELASCIGASDASVESAMRALREHGLVSSGYRRVVIHDLDALRRLAAAPLEPIPQSRQPEHQPPPISRDE